MKSRACIAALFCSAQFGCDGAGSRRPSIEVADSAGIQIVSNLAVDALPSWELVETPDASIGLESETAPVHQFTEISGAVRLSDGRIVVGDRESREARYFDEVGAHLLTVGGAGEGPGELRSLYAVDRIRGDSVVLGGWPIGTRYWFDHTGGFVRNQALGPWYPGILGRTLPDGALVLDTYEFGSYGNTLEQWAAFGPDEDLRPEGVLERVSREGEHIDTVAPFRGETWHKTGVLRESFAMHALPFSPHTLLAWSAEHLFVAEADVAEVRVYDLEGRLVRLIRWPAAPRPVGRADRDEFESEVLTTGGRPERLPMLRRWLAEISYPEFKPLISEMVATESGWLWVRPAVLVGDLESEWLVFAPSGRAGAHIGLPAQYEILDVDATHVVAKATDDLGIETVHVHRVVQNGGGDPP